MRLYGFNKFIAVTPFASTEASLTVHKGFAALDQKTKMTSLEVIAGNMEGLILKGMKVWVDAGLCKQPWANKIYNTSFNNEPEVSYILLPESEIRLIEDDLPNPWDDIRPLEQV